MSIFKLAAQLLIGVVLLFPTQANAQEQLTLEQAIRIGLENNYDIRIASTQEAVAENNVTLGNAGFLPTLDGRLTRDYSNNNIRNQFENNEPRIVDGSKTQTTNANALLNWTLFDGGRMFINLNRLRALEQSGELFTKATVEVTVADIIAAYYEVVRQAQKIAAIKDAIEISEQRVTLTEEQVKVGVSAKVEVLRAQVDYNADRSELLQQQETLQNAKINLNQLLGREPSLNFTVIDSIAIDKGIKTDIQQNNLVVGNPNLRRIQLQRDIALHDLRLARSLRLPTIGLSGSYGLNQSLQDPVIFGNTVGTNESTRRGFNYGVTLLLPVFNGFEINRQVQNARLNIETSSLLYQQEQNRLQAELARAYSRYNNRLQILELEESNVTLALQNAEIALERYRLGLLNALELREAQRNQLVAKNRLIDIRYEAKVAETEFKRISSTLLQEKAL